MYVDDAVDMMEELPANIVKRVMRAATPETRALINQYLKYPDNSAGSIMTAEFVDLKKYMNVRESIARIRRVGEDKETIYVCYVTNAHRRLEGVVTVKDLLLTRRRGRHREHHGHKRHLRAAPPTTGSEAAERISDYDLLAIPVVDKEDRLVGIVTVDDVIDVLEEEATEDFDLMAGISPSDKPYSRTGVVEMWKRRIPWLMFLMLSATFTSMIITQLRGRAGKDGRAHRLHTHADGHRRQLRLAELYGRHTQPVHRRHGAERHTQRYLEGDPRGRAVRSLPGLRQLCKNARSGPVCCSATAT